MRRADWKLTPQSSIQFAATFTVPGRIDPDSLLFCEAIFDNRGIIPVGAPLL
jgi:hypothetical protein